jgi:predicted peroxiredoxin
MNTNVLEIFEAAKKDPELFSTLDIENILESVENEKNDYLENKTMEDIMRDVFENIHSTCIDKNKVKKICDKLVGYRCVDEIHELFKGRHVRWIRRGAEVLTTGGIVVDIKFLKDGIQILIKNNLNRFIQYKFDDCITFQKLSAEEQLLLMAYEELQK